jgi:alanine-glyoxylate transaminase/(R)-3-amino-2-methylpropionate-pyruvate transaminase
MEEFDLHLLRNKFIFSCIKTYYDEPLVIKNGNKQYLYDQTGREYLDFYSGVATATMGYCDEYITEKIVNQLKEIQHVPTLYMSEPMLNLAYKLVEKLGNDNYRVLFCNSGSEGIEYISLLARLYKQNGYLLSMSHGYHGMTLNANYLTGIESWKHHEGIKLNSYSINSPYCYRCKYRGINNACGFECSSEIENTIQSLDVDLFSGLIFEPIQGVGGVIVPPKEYYNIAIEIVKKYGGLVLVDEVQTGIGKTGQWYGFQNFNIEPDAFCLGKGLGNGLPIGAVIAREHLSELFSNNLIYSTFGSNPVVCTSALATMEKIEQDNTLQTVTELSTYLISKLEELYDFKCIGDIRGVGLLVGIEIVKDKVSKEPDAELALRIQNKLREYNVLVGIGGVYRNVIRIAPPFIINKDNIDTFCNSFRYSILNLQR